MCNKIQNSGSHKYIKSPISKSRKFLISNQISDHVQYNISVQSNMAPSDTMAPPYTEHFWAQTSPKLLIKNSAHSSIHVFSMCEVWSFFVENLCQNVYKGADLRDLLLFETL